MGKFFEALEKHDAGKTQNETTIIADKDDANEEQLPKGLSNAAADAFGQPDADGSVQPEYGTETSAAGETPPRTVKKADETGRVQLDFDQNLVAYHDPRSFEAEQFRMLRTNILFPPNGKSSPRTILVTSALPGEGKSFVSSNLAFTIAQNIDKHVLLIDGDMRQPTIHKIFGYENAPGLSDYLSGRRTLPDLLLKTGSNHLSILPGGPLPSNPAELLSSNRMLALLREVRSRYDDRYIVIDSPPPHLTAESKALAQFVDGIIIVVKFGMTNRDYVVDLVKKFQKDKILGVVANWLDKGSTNLYGSAKYSQYGYFNSKNAN